MSAPRKINQPYDKNLDILANTVIALCGSENESRSISEHNFKNKNELKLAELIVKASGFFLMNKTTLH